MSIFLSSAEIPRPIQHVNQGADVILTTIKPLSHASERFEDLEFAVEFSGWRVLNHLQFQEVADLDKCLAAVVRCLDNMRGGEVHSAAEGEALSELHTAAVSLQELCNRGLDEVGTHTLTATSPRVRAIGLPLALSAFGVHQAAPDARSVLMKKLASEVELARASPFPLEFRRFSGMMTVTSLRDVRHLVSLTQALPNPRYSSCTTKVLIRGACLGEARQMLAIIEENREVAGFELSDPVSSWERNGWEVYSHTTFEKLLCLADVNDILRVLKSGLSAANVIQLDEHYRYLLQAECESVADKLTEAHGHHADFEVLNLPGFAYHVRLVGQMAPAYCGHWGSSFSAGHRDSLLSLIRPILEGIASLREIHVHFSLQ